MNDRPAHPSVPAPSFADADAIVTRCAQTALAMALVGACAVPHGAGAGEDLGVGIDDRKHLDTYWYAWDVRCAGPTYSLQLTAEVKAQTLTDASWAGQVITQDNRLCRFRRKEDDRAVEKCVTEDPFSVQWPASRTAMQCIDLSHLEAPTLAHVDLSAQTESSLWPKIQTSQDWEYISRKDDTALVVEGTRAYRRSVRRFVAVAERREGILDWRSLSSVPGAVVVLDSPAPWVAVRAGRLPLPKDQAVVQEQPLQLTIDRPQVRPAVCKSPLSLDQHPLGCDVAADDLFGTKADGTTPDGTWPDALKREVPRGELRATLVNPNGSSPPLLDGARCSFRVTPIRRRQSGGGIARATR